MSVFLFVLTTKLANYSPKFELSHPFQMGLLIFSIIFFTVRNIGFLFVLFMSLWLIFTFLSSKILPLNWAIWGRSFHGCIRGVHCSLTLVRAVLLTIILLLNDQDNEDNIRPKITSSTSSFQINKPLCTQSKLDVTSLKTIFRNTNTISQEFFPRIFGFLQILIHVGFFQHGLLSTIFLLFFCHSVIILSKFNNLSWGRFNCSNSPNKPHSISNFVSLSMRCSMDSALWWGDKVSL